MGKRRPAFDPRQVAFDFTPPEARLSEGGLSALDRVVASAVSAILRDDPRTRYEVAGLMSELLADDVAKTTLDAYSAEAKENHNISLTRFFALVVVSQRYDVLGQLLRGIGADLLVGEEVHLAEIGHLKAQKRDIDARLKRLSAVAQPLQRGEGSR